MFPALSVNVFQYSRLNFINTELFKQKYSNNIQKNNLLDEQIPNQTIFEIFQQKCNSIKYEYTKLLELQLNVIDFFKRYSAFPLFICGFF